MSSLPRVAIADLAEGDIVLPDTVAHKLLRVLRLSVGDSFVAFDPRKGVQAKATLHALSPARALFESPALGLKAKRDIRLLQGVAKGDKNESILQDATELGASAVHFVHMQRSVVRVPDNKREARLQRWKSVAEHAAAQSGRADVPRVLGPSSLAEALAAHQDARVLVLYEDGGAPFAAVLRDAMAAKQPVLLVVGPEGGIAAEDIEHLMRASCTFCTLGPYVLRTETVAAAALGAAMVLA